MMLHNKQGMLTSLLVLLLCLTGCGKRTAPKVRRPAMKVDVLLPTTPVKNQGNSTLCWDYAMLATIETEHLVRGDSVNLSPDYLARRFLEEQARECYFDPNHKPLSMRGMGSTVLRLLNTYGMEPFDSYHNYEGVNYNALAKKAMNVVRSAASLELMNSRLTAILDDGIGFLPTHVFMLGAEYTPIEFAHSVCLPDEYESLTSVTHHPFYHRFVLESPDNHYRDSYLNVPIDTLMNLITKALRQGHPVCWEGDISEDGFSFEKGVATLGGSERVVTQEQRQRELERHRTTDDHAMELCGLAQDPKGRRFFIAKNSWGKGNVLGGFMFLSYDYVKLKTIAVFLSR